MFILLLQTFYVPDISYTSNLQPLKPQIHKPYLLADARLYMFKFYYCYIMLELKYKVKQEVFK